jgi:hypothetical protein
VRLETNNGIVNVKTPPARAFKLNGRKALVQSGLRIKDLDKLNLVKLAYSDMVLGLSQFSILPQLRIKITIASKAVKSDLKIIILL